jgi:HK97 family phage prohead protease
MEKIFNLTSTFKSHTEDDGSIMIRGMASTADFDRAGDSISADAWTKGGLNNFEKNPIILFNHDYNRPIGRATGLKSTENGLELTAKISKAAKDVAELVKDGVLGAFSVGFRVKDADYLEETDGLRIKDAELFEVSVVSVPCNQSATFSLAKSFDSMAEYEDFKKTFTISDGTQVQKEIQMSEETTQPVDLEAFAKKVAEETAAKIAMKQAEQKATEVAAQKDLEDQATANAEAKSQQEEEVKSAVISAMESGTERLLKDLDSKVAEKDAQIDQIMREHEADLKERSDEISKMRDSKRVFSDRGQSEWTDAQKQELVHASILGKITRKGWDTDYAKSVLEKAGVDYGSATTSANIDVIVANTFEEEVRQEQRVAGIFRELAVNSGSTVMPIAPDTENANWNATGLETVNNLLEEAGASDNNYSVGNVILRAHRLISGTYIANDVEEQVVITMLPIITSALARAHARAIDQAFMVGQTAFKGIVGGTGTDGANSPYAADSATVADLNNNGTVPLTAAMLMSLRSEMGKYGIRSPSDIVYIVNNEEYFSLISDGDFSDVSEVGSDTAMKLIGQVGSVYGSPVVATDAISRATGTTAAVAVAHRNYVIPRLKGVSIETDYEVAGQRTAIVAAQSLGFNQLVTGTSAIRAEYT